MNAVKMAAIVLFAAGVLGLAYGSSRREPGGDG
jgi:hypothetical protein